MKIPQIINIRAIRRVVLVMLAALLFVAGLPMIQPSKASAAQLTSRSITMSDSAISGTSITSGVGSGTNVIYQVAFTATTQAGSIVIDFCKNDPILSDTCTAITGFNASAATLTNTTSTGQVGVAGNGWTITPTTGQVKLGDDGVSGHDIQASSTQKFELNGITNASSADLGTFYARIYTYANNTQGTYSSATSLGNYVDYGGIAMSTTIAITITARVQESLTFCISAADSDTWTTNFDCSDPNVASNPPSIILGHGSPTAVLDSNTVDTKNLYTQLSTNATNGAVINFRNSNLTCGGLSADGGTTCGILPIDVVNSSPSTPSALTAGSAAIGLFVAAYTPPTNPPPGAVGSVAPDPSYNDGTNVGPTYFYGMEFGAGGVDSTYGSTVASTAGPVYRADNVYQFAASAALTTPAGIYTANYSMIATGTF